MFHLFYFVDFCRLYTILLFLTKKNELFSIFFSHVVTIQDNSSRLVLKLTANSINQQLSMEYVNSTGLISAVFLNVNLSDGICHHLALVVFNSTVQLFADGNVAAEETTLRNLWNISGNIFIGGVPSGSVDDYFMGT